MSNKPPHLMRLAQQLMTRSIPPQNPRRLERPGPDALQNARMLRRSTSSLRYLHGNGARHIQQIFDVP
jgi:hypothetical protein